MDRLPDLAPEERGVHRLLSAVAPVAPPFGFRDAVMQQVGATRRLGLVEWVIAAALAVPSLLFLIWEVATRGADFSEALGNAFIAAQNATADDLFFVDGTIVLAVALLGLGSLIATHALLFGGERRDRIIAH
ncbi:MAG: hypothetical protein HY071_07085 [Chloroflexi bacterium]|nr:hypothetical protein [Chloroflexota bacterium]